MTEEGDEENDVCVACGDGADSAEELQELLEEKGGA